MVLVCSLHSLPYTWQQKSIKTFNRKHAPVAAADCSAQYQLPMSGWPWPPPSLIVNIFQETWTLIINEGIAEWRRGLCHVCKLWKEICEHCKYLHFATQMTWTRALLLQKLQGVFTLPRTQLVYPILILNNWSRNHNLYNLSFKFKLLNPLWTICFICNCWDIPARRNVSCSSHHEPLQRCTV